MTSRLHDYSYVDARWNLAFPVRKGRFIAQHRGLERFNVEVDLGRLSTFAALREAVPSPELGYADLQTNPALHRPGRLGAGRAGWHHGRYLKGIGRTPLAANWNDPNDQKAATGHLAASAAVREYIATCYLRAKDRGALVNGCEGILLGQLDERLRDHGAYGYGEHARIAPCDAAMQAISVKGSVFARFSNFAWLINHIDLHSSRGDLLAFFLAFVAYLDPSTQVLPEDVPPERVATTFFSAVDRAIEHFREFWRLGIYWGTPFNNVTADGRYQDLDTVLFLGAPFLGVLPRESQRSVRLSTHNPSQIFGLEVLTYVQYMRQFHRFLVARLGSLIQMEAPLSRLECRFVRAAERAFRAQGRTHLLFSRPQLSDRLHRWLAEDGRLEGRALADAKRFVSRACAVRFGDKQADAELQLRPVALRAARPGTFREYAGPYATTGSEIPSAAVEEAQFMNDILRRLDEATEPDALLAGVDEATASITRYCSAPS